MTNKNNVPERGLGFPLWLTTVAILCFVGTGISQKVGIGQEDGRLAKRPLDLPSGGLGDNEDEEDAPEVISFYGSNYEGNAFFWCLDRSGSMEWGAAINVLKSEMTRAIGQLSTDSEFSVVSFASNVKFWSNKPKKATPNNKSSAIAWVNSMEAVGGTCLGRATVATLGIAEQCRLEYKRVIVVGDGIPWCSGPPNPEQTAQTLAEINAANWSRMPIDAIFISSSEDGIALFQAIANNNNGTFYNP